MFGTPRFSASRLGRAHILSLLTLAAAALSTTPANAQDLTFTTITEGEFGGQLGTMMRMVPGANDPIRQTTYMKGTLTRTDNDDGFTVMNPAEGRFTEVMHPSQTYYSFTIAQMQERMAAAFADVEAMPDEEVPAAPEEEEEVSFDVKLSSERTGRVEDFGEYTAEQVLLIIEMIPRTDEARDAMEEGGAMVLFTELWMSQDFPGYEEYMEAQKEMGEAFMASGGGQDLAAAYQQAFASDPRMQEAFAENLEAMKEVEGMQVRSISSFVIVPAGVEFNADAILAANDQPLGEGVGSALGGAAKEGAKEAARGAVRGLTRGLLGRRSREEPKEEKPAPAQSILMRMKSYIEGISTDVLSMDLFGPPEGYTEEVPEWIGGGGH